MKQTGKFVTVEQFDKVQELANRAIITPVIALTSKHALERGGFSGEAWQRVHDEIDRLADTLGLPSIKGEYGLDLNREILAP